MKRLFKNVIKILLWKAYFDNLEIGPLNYYQCEISKMKKANLIGEILMILDERERSLSEHQLFY